jgi:hypothetical protein
MVFALFLAVGAPGLKAQQPPKSNRTGDQVSIVRNDATTPVTIEYKTNNEWKQLSLEPGADTTIAGDRIRVATTRDDKAIVTVDMPLQAGKKYRLVWNAQSSIWDFSTVS